ncbi:hypothetical protein [Methylomicrobium lacus]|uniref:hypothetical protein n=1 Tax=Methylomicrobium lacus TaxID=136992 RepID=UPI0035A9422F
MHRKLESPKFLQGLGQLVVDFGFMERAVRSVIIVMARDHHLAKALVPPGNTVSQNLELLRRICIHKVQEEALAHWLAAIDDLKSIFEERNKIFHGMFYAEEHRVLLSRVSKGKRQLTDRLTDIEIEDDFITALHKRLNDRRRQLMDFCDDYYSDETGPAHQSSQDAHPSLSYGK